MFSHVFEQNYWHIVAASLLLIWTLFNAIIDGVFSPKKWREMPKAKKHMYLAFFIYWISLVHGHFFCTYTGRRLSHLLWYQTHC